MSQAMMHMCQNIPQAKFNISSKIKLIQFEMCCLGSISNGTRLILKLLLILGCGLF